MKTKLDRPLCVLDVESTGTNTVTDRIISIGIVKIMPDGEREHFYRTFNPGRTIPDDVVRLTGITNEAAASSPPFTAKAGETIVNFLDGCYLGGFNLLNFDLPIIAEEMARVDVAFKVDFARVIDAGNIFKKMEERTLSAASRFYLGRAHDGAHHALEDARVTGDVLAAQVGRYPDLAAMSMTELAAFSQFDQRIDIAGKLVRGPDGDPVYNFAKVKGTKVKDDLGFAQWMLGKDFPRETKARLEEILADIFEEPDVFDHAEAMLQDEPEWDGNGCNGVSRAPWEEDAQTGH